MKTVNSVLKEVNSCTAESDHYIVHAIFIIYSAKVSAIKNSVDTTFTGQLEYKVKYEDAYLQV